MNIKYFIIGFNARVLGQTGFQCPYTDRQTKNAELAGRFCRSKEDKGDSLPIVQLGCLIAWGEIKQRCGIVGLVTGKWECLPDCIFSHGY